MIKIFLVAIASIFSFNSFSQSAPASSVPTIKELIEDATTNFEKNTGELVTSDASSTYYAPKKGFGFGSEEFIVLDKDTKNKTFLCYYKESTDGKLNTDALKTMIDWITAMQELGKTEGYKFERKPKDGGGFINSLYNSRGILLADVKHDSKMRLLMVYGNYK